MKLILILILLNLSMLVGCSSEPGEVEESTSPVVVEEDTEKDETDDEPTTDDPVTETTEQKLTRLALESPEPCQMDGQGVNVNALLDVDCQLLSQYRLFLDPTQPQINANGNGFNYQLSVELFSDYANKYRFVFVPENQTMTFSATDTFDMPLGTVIVKTFAMPFDTAIKGIEHERLIETRLLIKRTTGWVGLPFKWTDGGEDAVLTKYGAIVDIDLTNDQQTLSFRYEVPSKTTCQNCHQRELTDDVLDKKNVKENVKKSANQAANINSSANDNDVVFSPIGLKARFLNWSPNDNNQTQLAEMQQLGLLSGGINDLTNLETVPRLAESAADIRLMAKGYLDINCAHCHQSGGFAGISGLRLEFWREETSLQHGICKKPPGYDGGLNHLSYDIVPGDAGSSILVHRMSVTTPKDVMPPVGRHIIHRQGIELVSRWIDNMPLVSCGQ